MKKLLASGLFVVAASSLVGCGNQFSTGIHKSVQVNQDAKTLAEWEASDSNPEALFSQWREDSVRNPKQKDQMSEQLCSELQALDGQSLSIFEQEIKDPHNAALVGSCKQTLLQQLERYYAAQRATLSVQVNAMKPVDATTPPANNFQFQVNIQKRDYSKGYLAVTGDIQKKEVILTFDDGPSVEYTKSILASLKEVNAKAHFFEMGKNVRANPEITKLVAASGNMLGSHTVTHSCIGNLKECGHANGGVQFAYDKAVAEIQGGHQAIYDVVGWVDPMFRFPYGATTPELSKFLADNGVAQFYWSIDSEDWKAQSNENLLHNVLTQLDAKGKGLILFHDIQRKTAEILPQLLSELYSRGYSIVQLQPADPSARYNSKLVKKHLP